MMRSLLEDERERPAGRRWRPRGLGLAVAASLAWGCGGDAAGAPGAYGSTLARLPVDFITTSTMAGSGSVTATVDGDQLSIRGSFEGVESPVTGAHLHRARPGLRGPAVAGLTATSGTAGTFEGVIQLDQDLRAALEANELYVQLHSEANPDGVLRGWLFPEGSE